MSAVPEAHRAIDAVWRIESARLIAGLARIVRDVGLAEDLAQEALVAALEQWPEAGIPDNPGAWLMATAKHRAIDGIRHSQMAERKREEIAREMDTTHEPDLDAQADDDIGDDLLTLIFTACHPVLNTEGRIALTLRLVGALTTPEIARAFVVPEKTMAQRIVRAKKTLATAGVSFETPHGEERDERLASVLEVVYAIFNEGYSATAGDDWMRPALTEDALRLGRILAGLAPDEPEVHGLMALMEIQASRAKARTDADGVPILLLDQDRARWDQLLIRRGLGALERAERLSAGRPGPYTLQAAIAACHARARRPERHRLGPHRAALRQPGHADRLTGGGAEPRGGRGHGGGPRGRPSAWWTSWWPRATWTATTCCPACAATCWPSWAARTRRAPSSSAPPG